MKKVNIVFIVLLVISILMTIVGFICGIGALPVQDPQYAPASVLRKIEIYNILFTIFSTGGGLLFWGTIIWRSILAVVHHKNKKTA